jgi:hypothetical protein
VYPFFPDALATKQTFLDCGMKLSAPRRFLKQAGLNLHRASIVPFVLN